MNQVLIILLIFFASVSCSNNRQKVSHPVNNEVRYAKHLMIERGKDYSVVTILDPWQGSGNIRNTWYLIPEGSEPPAGVDISSVIFVPVKNIICMSVTYTAMIEAIGMQNTISAISGRNLYYSEKINERIRNGVIMDVGYESTLDNELVVKLSPDLVMMYGVGGESTMYSGKLKELGIKTLFNADYLETDPLGKAEWIKLFGELYCMRETADSIFNAEAAVYKAERDKISTKIIDRPNVLLGLPFKDTWYISPGNSYINALINDAGGNYLWKEVISSISMPYGLEAVYERAVNASYWFNAGTAHSKDEIAAIDIRFTHLKCFQNGNIFNNTGRVTHAGGNDYWETGSLHPHLILEDMAEIMHPGVLGKHDLYFFTRL